MGGKKRRVKAISDWLEGGLNVFIKKFGGICGLDARYINFKRGPLAKLGKQLNSRAQTICVKQ